MNPSLYVVFPYHVPQPFNFDSQINFQGFDKRHVCYFEPKRVEGLFVKLIRGENANSS